MVSSGRYAYSTESPRLWAKIERARDRQLKRFNGVSVPYNAAIPGGEVRQCCCFSDVGLDAFETIIDQSTLSTRSMDRLAKVARTVADLADSDEVHPEHVKKTASFVVGGMLRASG